VLRKSQTSAISLVILGCLVCVGGFFRFDHLGRQSLWVDEYWALYLATGRGDFIFDLPRGRVIESPPAVGFVGAPHWWHIWMGLASTPHPPLYHLALRFWVDLFGDGDFVTRALSACAGIGCIVLMFEVVRRIHGDYAGLIAAGIMAFSAVQIDFSQQDRPYTLLVFVGLIVCESVVLIDQRGLSWPRILLLGCGSLCLMLTHYFAIGAIIAVGIYARIRFGGRRRTAVLVTIGLSLLVMAAIWGSIAWHNRHSYIAGPHFGVSGESLWLAVIEAPGRLVVGDSRSRLISYGLAFLVYVLPLLKMRGRPELLFWWIWTVGTLGVVISIDILRSSQLTAMSRYIILASPGVYVLLATSLERGMGRLLPLAVLFAAVVFGIARWQTGSDFVRNTSAMARLMEKKVGAGDAVIITGHFDSEPAFRYFILAHYGGDWRNTVVLLTEPPDSELDRQLESFRRVWVIGSDGGDMRLLPGWKIMDFQGVEPGFCLWRIVRPRI
jgi:hypothetical protein